MGKKGKKEKPKVKGIYKVAGAISLKKPGSKAVTPGLKNLRKSKSNVRDKVEEIDQQLVKLQEKLITKPEPKKSKEQKLPQQEKRQTRANVAKDTKEAVDNIGKMEL